MSQYINKVIVNGETKIDLTADTVDPDSLAEGFTAHDKTGQKIIGTLSDKDITDCKISGNTVIIPPGNYSRGIRIAFQNWDWDPFDFESSFITDASGVISMDEI